MPVYLDIDEREFRKRGGCVCGDDDFVVVELTCCKVQCLHNEETLQFYLDPERLSDCHLFIEGHPAPPCPRCGRTDWDFADVDLSLDQIRAGPWGWLIRGRPQGPAGA